MRELEAAVVGTWTALKTERQTATHTESREKAHTQYDRCQHQTPGKLEESMEYKQRKTR